MNPPTIILQPTTRMVEVNGVLTRVWEGSTSDSRHVFALIAQIGVHPDADQSEFEASLIECRPPSKVAQSIPLRMII